MVAASKSYLVDSVIVIDHLNGIEAATAFLAENAGRTYLSVITRAEVLAGTEKGDVSTVKQFLDEFSTLEVTSEIADAAAALRRTHGWRLPDALQAALAKRNRLSLVTRNTRDFSPTRYKFVTVPYRL